jgi:hypothetical protein
LGGGRSGSLVHIVGYFKSVVLFVGIRIH